VAGSVALADDLAAMQDQQACSRIAPDEVVDAEAPSFGRVDDLDLRPGASVRGSGPQRITRVG